MVQFNIRLRINIDRRLRKRCVLRMIDRLRMAWGRKDCTDSFFVHRNYTILMIEIIMIIITMAMTMMIIVIIIRRRRRRKRRRR